MEVGTICTKNAGDEKGKKVVVVDVIDKSFALIDGLGVKRRRCNVKHLKPEGKVSIKRGADTKEAVAALGL